MDRERGDDRDEDEDEDMIWVELPSKKTYRQLEMDLMEMKRVPLDVKIPQAALEDIQPGMLLSCLPGCVYTPGDFSVIVEQKWNFLEFMMDDLQRSMNDENEFVPFNPPNEEDLVEGSIVAVKRQIDGQWNRGKILKKRGNDFDILLMDYGDRQRTLTEDIRFLPSKFGWEFKVHAIRCVCEVTDREPSMRFPWTEAEGDIFRQLIYNRYIAVHFLEFIKIDGEPAWLVNIHRLHVRPRSSPKIDLPFVERETLRNTHTNLDEQIPPKKTPDLSKLFTLYK